MKKSISERLDELRTSLRALNNAYDHFEKTLDEAYFYDIVGRIRVLVCTGSRTMSPLLIELSKELGIELEIFSHPPRTIGKERIHDSLVIGKTWSTHPMGNFQKFTLEEWLATPMYFLRHSRCFLSRNYVIREIAEKEGGAHFDKRITPLIAQLRSVNYGIGKKIKLNGLQMILLDISPAIYLLGERMIQFYELKKIEDSIVLTEQGRQKSIVAHKKKIFELNSYFEKLRPFNMFSFEVEFPES